MSATHYLLTVTYGTKPGNKLCDDIYNDLKSKNRNLIKANQLDRLKEAVLQTIDNYNRIHIRCKPVRASWFEMDRNEEHYTLSLSLNGLTFINVKIVGVKEVQL